jgi:predicted small secreted protein
MHCIRVSAQRARRGLETENMMVRKAFAVALVAGTLLIAGCNTVNGAGKDVSSAGNAISNAAK